MSVAALHPGWLEVIDAEARTRFGPRDRTGAALAEAVAALSQVYNRRGGRLRDQEAAHVARLRFFLPRDLPKVAGPLSELASAGALPEGRRWRLLDLGAGLGTTGLGVASVAPVDTLDIQAVERDAAALEIYAALAARATRAGLIPPVSLATSTADLATFIPETGAWDLVVVGLALNELFESDVSARVAWLGRIGGALAPGGSLIVLEPALRDVTRALMAVRDRVGDVGLSVFGPCTHRAACPLLATERDWCHEVAPIALPEPLHAIARAAGLRFERLTWSALTLRRDDRQLAPGAFRVVAGPLASKGKTEWDLCGAGRITRLTRLDRHRATCTLGDAGRGTLLEMEGPLGERVRADRVTLHRRG